MRTQVITTEGRRIGEVSDIAVDDQGNVLGYHLSHNILRDTFRGKPFLPAGVVRAVATTPCWWTPRCSGGGRRDGAEPPKGPATGDDPRGEAACEPGAPASATCRSPHETAAADQATEPSAPGEPWSSGIPS